MPGVKAAVAAGPEAVAQRLEELLGDALEQGAEGRRLRVPDHDGVPLRTYTHADKEVSEVLEHARALLPPHVQEVRVDLAGWTAAQVARFCILLHHTASTVFSTDKWDVGFCQTLPFRIDTKPDTVPHSDRPYRYSPAMTALIKQSLISY